MSLYVHPIDHNFKVDDEVVDKTAEANGWPDRNGRVVEVDGSNIKVKYTSGNQRWKMHINLRMIEVPICSTCPNQANWYINLPGIQTIQLCDSCYEKCKAEMFRQFPSDMGKKNFINSSFRGENPRQTTNQTNLTDKGT